MDFAFSYDYDLFVNETTHLGLLRSFSYNMVHSSFKGKEFVLKRRQMGQQMFFCPKKQEMERIVSF